MIYTKRSKKKNRTSFVLALLTSTLKRLLKRKNEAKEKKLKKDRGRASRGSHEPKKYIERLNVT